MHAHAQPTYPLCKIRNYNHNNFTKITAGTFGMHYVFYRLKSSELKSEIGRRYTMTTDNHMNNNVHKTNCKMLCQSLSLMIGIDHSGR